MLYTEYDQVELWSPSLRVDNLNTQSDKRDDIRPEFSRSIPDGLNPDTLPNAITTR